MEPVEAERLVREGTRFVVQHCRTPPIAERPERFKKDVRAHMLTSAAADAYANKLTVPTVMVGELWNSSVAGDLLLFVEQGPHRRSVEELQDD